MNKGKCINPCILAAVSRLGHGERILIADGNYPLSLAISTGEKRTYANLLLTIGCA